MPLSSYEVAEKICIDFASRYEINFIRYGACGFGRPCSGFARRDAWLWYNPNKWIYASRTALNPTNYEPVPEFAKAELHAPPGVKSYHKDDLLCVLHGEGSIDGAQFSKPFGLEYDFAVDLQMLDRNKPRTPVMEEAVVQLATWVNHLEKLAADMGSELFVADFDKGYQGLQAQLNDTYATGIGIR